MFFDWKPQQINDVNSPHTDLQLKYNPSHTPSCLSFPVEINKQFQNSRVKGGMDSILGRCKLLTLTQEQTDLTRPVRSKGVELVISKFPIKKAQAHNGFTSDFYQTLWKESIPTFHKIFQNKNKQTKPQQNRRERLLTHYRRSTLP